MYHQLTSEQRSQIFALLQKKTARKEIARIVGTSEATLSRELKRNGTPSGKYIWTKAHDMAMQRGKRMVTNAKLSDELVWRIKEYIINDQWSPRQISGYLRKNEGIKVSHQSIYNIIHNDTTGALAKNTRHKMKYRLRPKGRHLPIKDRVSIHERSKEVDGKRFGDFEMDLIVDPDQHAILTLVEKSTNMPLVRKLPCGKQSKPLAKVVRKLLPYKDSLKTITTDNGPEFAAHKDITKYLGVPVYFADPYCSWQKGAIENINKLIRQYIPKKDSFERYTDKRIMSIQKKLNEIPREKLNFSTPKCEFSKHVL